MKQKFWFNGFHLKLMSTEDSPASFYVPSLNALDLVEHKLSTFKV